jgi:PAS domain S-box-containing protein
MKKSLDGIWIIDVDGKTVFANARMAEILGATVDQMIGRDSFDYLYPEDAPAAQRLFEAKVRGDSKPFHFKLRRADGSAVWADVQGTSLHNAAGVFNGIVGTFTVSTELPAGQGGGF